MAAQYHSIDLAQLALSPGGGRRLEIEVKPGGLDLGGQHYETATAAVPVHVDVSRTAGGYALRLSFATEVAGPCMRCLDEARVPVSVEAREVDQGVDDEELTSPYVEGEVLDLSGWAHDALVLALPAQLLCRPDCAGLCPVCGESLNDADPAAHQHSDRTDSPWAKLGELLE